MCKISLFLPYNDNKNDAPSERVVTVLYFPVCFYLFWYCFPDVLDLLAFHSFMLPMSEAASKIFWFFILPYHNFSIFEMLGRDAGNHVWNVKVHGYLCVHTSHNFTTSALMLLHGKVLVKLNLESLVINCLILLLICCVHVCDSG